MLANEEESTNYSECVVAHEVCYSRGKPITKRSVRRVTIKASGQRVCTCVRVCVFADKSRPKRQFSYREEGGGVVLPFCRLIAQVVPKKKKTTIVIFVVVVCRRAHSGVCVFLFVVVQLSWFFLVGTSKLESKPGTALLDLCVTYTELFATEYKRGS